MVKRKEMLKEPKVSVRTIHVGVKHDGKHNPTTGNWKRALIGKGFYAYRIVFMPTAKLLKKYQFAELNICSRNEKEAEIMFRKSGNKGKIISIELLRRDNFIGNDRNLNVGTSAIELAFTMLAKKTLKRR